MIVNGAECEPLLRVDQLLMQYHADRVVRGLELAMKAAHTHEGVIATKTHYEQAVEALRRATQGKPNLRLHLMESYYPSGDEKNVIFEVTGTIVPSGKLPIDVGCVVINVGTAVAIVDAAEGKSVTDKNVTVCGDVPDPVTVTIPVGTAMRDVLALSGFSGNEHDYALIVGGPCMGALAENWDDPVTKTTGGLLVLKRDHPQVRMRQITMQQQARLARAICCQCNRCTMLCPRHAIGLPVEPHKAMRAISTGNAELLGNAAGVLACSSCGLCTNFACEMGLTPSVVMTMLKQEMSKAGIKPTPEKSITPDPWIVYKEVPVKRLIARMHLSAFDRPAPLSDRTVAVRSVRIPLRQHVGKPAEPVVSVGDRVEKGQLIGRIPDKALGAAVHASINGTVTEVTTQNIVLTGE